MGVLTDLFIAADAEVRQLNFERTPLTFLPGIDIKGIQLVELATLQCILTGQDFTNVDYVVNLVGTFELIYEEEEAWVYKLPQPLSAALMKASIDRISQVAATWANTEEFRSNRIANARTILKECLKEMVHFARQASTEGKEMYVWICL